MELTIDELRSLTTPAAAPEKLPSTPVSGSATKIVICQRGWVFVGKVIKDGSEVVITAAKNVRQWGTTRGLGEIAASGPISKTVMDDYGTVRVHELSIVATIDCNDAKWGA